MAKTRLTAEGIAKYEQRLEYLKTVARTDIAEQIKVARSFGDLSENAEYDAAKTEQARIEYEIVEIETLLKDVELIDEENITTDIINVGNSVVVKQLSKGGAEVEYFIVGSAEANPFERRISNESPVGKALIGKKVGMVVDVVAPGGVNKLEIIKIAK